MSSAAPGALPAAAGRARPWHAAIAYGLMLVAGIGLFCVIREVGEAIPRPTGIDVAAARPAAAAKADALPRVLLALAAVVATGWLLGRAFRSLGQPPVIGEVVAGILL